MAINQNHLFEELNGVKCAIVEKNASQSRVDFLKKLLELNGYEVVVVPSPPPKVAAPIPPKAAADTDANATQPEPPPSSAIQEPPAPESFTIGVTDVVFNPTNAIFGRLLRTTDGHIVTLAYWQQKENIALDDIPYFDK
jgi:hypothetical protein